jgi:hypothetical protein
MVHGLWLWFTVHGSWFTVHGSWFMVHGSWFMVHGSWFTVHPIDNANHDDFIVGPYRNP